MIPLFLGLTVSNLLLLGGVFALGLMARDGGGAYTGLYDHHVLFAIVAGLMVTFVHLVVYTYFMATTKWLGAAVDKANLDPQRFHEPSLARKKRVLAIAMTAVGVTMATMFAGAAADTIPNWPAMIHFVLGIATLGANALCALAEFQCIREQGRLMDAALAILNATPNVVVKSV